MYCSLIFEYDGQQNTKWNSSSIINRPSLTHNGQTRSAISEKINSVSTCLYYKRMIRTSSTCKIFLCASLFLKYQDSVLEQILF